MRRRFQVAKNLYKLMILIKCTNRISFFLFIYFTLPFGIFVIYRDHQTLMDYDGTLTTKREIGELRQPKRKDKSEYLIDEKYLFRNFGYTFGVHRSNEKKLTIFSFCVVVVVVVVVAVVVFSRLIIFYWLHFNNNSMNRVFFTIC